MTPAHLAVENEDLPRLRELLDGGVDVEEIDGGLTLLQHAVDVEIDAHSARRGHMQLARLAIPVGDSPRVGGG